MKNVHKREIMLFNIQNIDIAHSEQCFLEIKRNYTIYSNAFSPVHHVYFYKCTVAEICYSFKFI